MPKEFCGQQASGNCHEPWFVCRRYIPFFGKYPRIWHYYRKLEEGWRAIVPSRHTKILGGYYQRMKDELKPPVGYPCFARDFEESDPTSHGIDETEAAFLVGGLVMPGSESTSALLNWLVRGLAKWPNVQQETREEVDRVVDFDRTPPWEDEKSMPYIRAMVKELIRWAPGSKLGIIHSTTQDDLYLPL